MNIPMSLPICYIRRVGLQCIDLCRTVLCSILLEEQLEFNVMFVQEVHIVEDRTVIECVTRLATCSAGLTHVELFSGSHCINTAVLQSFKMIESSGHRDITWVVSVK